MLKVWKNFLRSVNNLKSKFMEDLNSTKRKAEGELSDLESKRLKSEEVSTPTKVRIKYHKYAAFVSYCGKGFQGMQIQCNLDRPTIELELFKALRKVNLIDDEDVKKPGEKLNFQRAARTDKNVSALKQMCSLKLPREQDKNLPNLVETMKNEHLPETIRIWGFTRATQGFDAKRSCDNRSYSYTCPSFSFAHLDELTQESFRLPKERVEEINKVLILFKGTHNFYNYTSNKKPDDRSLIRFILNIECGEPFIRDDLEFVKINVRGQSFMLHQIRKMIGVTIANIRGLVDVPYIERSFSPKERLDVPRAPGLGLLLEEVHYDWYNRTYEKTHEKLLWDKYEKELEEFRQKYIDSVIVETENNEKSMLEWLATLPLHRFDLIDESEIRASPLMRAHQNIKELNKEVENEKKLREIAEEEKKLCEIAEDEKKLCEIAEDEKKLCEVTVDEKKLCEIAEDEKKLKEIAQ